VREKCWIDGVGIKAQKEEEEERRRDGDREKLMKNLRKWQYKEIIILSVI
jgi:hypothetical protein